MKPVLQFFAIDHKSTTDVLDGVLLVKVLIKEFFYFPDQLRIFSFHMLDRFKWQLS